MSTIFDRPNLARRNKHLRLRQPETEHASHLGNGGGCVLRQGVGRVDLGLGRAVLSVVADSLEA